MTALPENLSVMPLNEYLELLGSDYPAPGGGSAGAVCAAVGTALVQMTCGINAKRAKNPNPERSRANAEACARIRRELLPLITEDAKVYEKLSLVWKDKGPALEAVAREACAIPVRIGELAIEALLVAESEIESTSKTLLSDLKQAAAILYHTYKSTTHHIDGNLGLMTDLAIVTKVRGDLAALEASASRLCELFQSLEGPR